MGPVPIGSLARCYGLNDFRTRIVDSRIPNIDASELANLRKSLAHLRQELDQANRACGRYPQQQTRFPGCH